MNPFLLASLIYISLAAKAKNNNQKDKLVERQTLTHGDVGSACGFVLHSFDYFGSEQDLGDAKNLSRVSCVGTRQRQTTCIPSAATQSQRNLSDSVSHDTLIWSLASNL